jgi:hypothetical protein
MEIAKYHLGTVIAVVIIVMSLSAFSSNPSIKGTPVFIGAIFLLILATRLLLAGQPFDFSCQPVRCRLIALASPRLAGRDLGG